MREVNDLGACVDSGGRDLVLHVGQRRENRSGPQPPCPRIEDSVEAAMGAASETERRSGGHRLRLATLHPAHIQAHREGEYVGQESFMSAREILDLARAAGVDARTRVLDLCCGSGGPALLLVRQTGCRIVGIGRSSEATHLARTSAEHQGLDCGATFIVAEALCPPIDAASFEAVLLYETMLAFEDKRRLVRVVRKLLRPGGRFRL